MLREALQFLLQAAQALEPATLIPLQLLAADARIVMVGDPQQLPATVISKAATASNLTQSLFERLQQASFYHRHLDCPV